MAIRRPGTARPILHGHPCANGKPGGYSPGEGVSRAPAPGARAGRGNAVSGSFRREADACGPFAADFGRREEGPRPVVEARPAGAPSFALKAPSSATGARQGAQVPTRRGRGKLRVSALPGGLTRLLEDTGCAAAERAAEMPGFRSGRRPLGRESARKSARKRLTPARQGANLEAS